MYHLRLFDFRLSCKMANMCIQLYCTNPVKYTFIICWLLSRYMQLAIDLLDKCYEEDTTYTRHLLRAELPKWNQHTCMTLAASFELTRFIAHPALQGLLNDHWHGRLNKVAHPKVGTIMIRKIILSLYK